MTSRVSLFLKQTHNGLKLYAHFSICNDQFRGAPNYSMKVW